MFKTYHALALASLLGLGVLAMPASTASAAVLPHVQQSLPGDSAGNQSLLQEVNHRRRWRHRHRDHFGLFIGPFGFGGGYGYGYPYRYSHRYHRGGSSAHVRWCHSRYRSYNPWNNSWVSYSGRVNYCRSPFRYY